MADITHGTWIKDGKAVDAVYQDNRILYGRNWYIDTRDFDNPGAWMNWSDNYKIKEKFNGLTVMAAMGDGAGLGQDLQAKQGETYTFSLYARYKRGTGKPTMYFPLIGLGVVNPGEATFSLNETWQRIAGTFTTTNDCSIAPCMERTSNNTNTLCIAGLKLERGSIATPYSQAPEDILN